MGKKGAILILFALFAVAVAALPWRGRVRGRMWRTTRRRRRRIIIQIKTTLSIQIGQLHASDINGENGDKKDHLHKKVNQQAHIGKDTKLLDGRHHGKHAKENDDQLEAQQLRDEPGLFFETERDPISHLEIKGSGDHRFG
jgi:hypothetical protein